MAYSVKKNCIYVDAAQSITVSAMKPLIKGILLTPNAANSRFVLKESASGTVVIDITIETIESRYMSFEAFGGIEVNTIFEVSTFTFLDSVILYGEYKAPVNKAVG